MTPLSDTGSDGGPSETIRGCWFGVPAVATRIDSCLSSGIDAAWVATWIERLR